VEIPEGTEVYTDPVGYIWKAPSIILSNIRPISSLPHWKDEKFCLSVIKETPEALKFVPNELKTEEFYLEAAKENGFVFEFIPDRFRSEKLCTIAARQNIDAWMVCLRKYIDV
jgi:hypothetical protein